MTSTATHVGNTDGLADCISMFIHLDVYRARVRGERAVSLGERSDMRRVEGGERIFCHFILIKLKKQLIKDCTP